MKLQLKKASTDVKLLVFIQDSSQTDGSGLTGLAYDTANLACYYVRPGSAAASLALATQTVTGAHADGGFKEIDATNMPGVYRLDLSDAVVATGVNSVVLMLQGATNMAPLTLEIQLTNFDLNSSAPDVKVTELADDVITAAAHDESTAYPIKSADTGNTQIARTGADSDTLETVSDQIDGVASDASDLWDAEFGYLDDAVVVVADGADDAARGTNLATALTAAAALTPGGNALSESNRAAVQLPLAHYKLTATQNLNTDFVDLIAMVPEMGGYRLPTDDDDTTTGTALSEFRPPRTLIYSDTNDVTVVNQSAQNVRLRGFGIAQLADDNTGSYHALYVSGNDNEGSQYDEMYFWHRRPDTEKFPVGFAKHVKGVWRNCIANGMAWRVGWDAANEGQFSAAMYNCESGAYSFLGDYPEAAARGTHKAINARLVDCRAVGLYASEHDSGFASFGGCTDFALPIESTCTFIRCEAGSRSFGIGDTNAGKYYDCRGGDLCFGSTHTSSAAGEFSGYAENCTVGAGSFGGRAALATTGKLSGTIVRCVSEGSALSWRVEGATIEDCLLTVGENNVDCITLLDSTSIIADSTIAVVEGGTGIPINAGSALNVAAVGNRYNNVSAAANGLGENVSNVGTIDVVPPTVVQIREEMDTNSTKLDETISSRSFHTVANVWAATGRALSTPSDYKADVSDVGLSTAVKQAIADEVLNRNVSNVEATADEHSLCTIVLATLESAIEETTWTIKRTNGETTHATKTVTVDADAKPITGVS